MTDSTTTLLEGAVQIARRITNLLTQDNIKEFTLTPYEAQNLTKEVQGILRKEPNINTVNIQDGCTLTIVGDLHGQLWNLQAIWKKHGYPSDTESYLFNGDLVDRGPQSTEVLLSIYAYKLLFPSKVFINRGNHESHFTNVNEGFRREVRQRYDIPTYETFRSSFRAIPLGAIVQSFKNTGEEDGDGETESGTEKIFITHGGIPSPVPTISEIQALNRAIEPIMDSSILTQLLWNDPIENAGVHLSKRGNWGVQFGADITAAFLKKNRCKTVLRSHEEISEGFRKNHSGSCVTLFSALFEQVTYITLDPSLKMEVEKVWRGEEPSEEQFRYIGFGDDEVNHMEEER